MGQVSTDHLLKISDRSVPVQDVDPWYMTGYFRCRPTPALSSSLDHEPIWYTEWSSNNSIRASQMHSRTRRGHVANTRQRTQRPVRTSDQSGPSLSNKYQHYRSMSTMKSRRGGFCGSLSSKPMRGSSTHKGHSDRDNRFSSSRKRLFKS